MSLDMLIVFAVILVAVVLFVSDRVSFDVTALLIAAFLMLTGILTPSEGLSGFSNEATITIAAMFVLSEAIHRTGALNQIGDFFSSLAKTGTQRTVIIMMLTVSVISAFINNTAAVAIFIPVVVGLSGRIGMSPSKLLMPISFASMFGGVCTLIGTSTNILVSSIAESHGETPFSMFEFLPLGLILLLAGFLYLMVVGFRLVPVRRTARDLDTPETTNEYLTDLILTPESKHLGKTIQESQLTKDLDLDIVTLLRDGRNRNDQLSELELQAGDILRVKGGVPEIDQLLDHQDVALRPTQEWYEASIPEGNEALVEAVVAPDSTLESTEIHNVNFPERFGAVILGIRHHGEIQQDNLGKVRLSGGDSVLMAVERDRISDVRKDRSFVLASEVGLPKYRTEKLPWAILILAGVVTTAALSLLPIVVSAVTGILLMIFAGCITTEEAYQSINWKVILLLAGVLPLGIAMDKTGAAALLSDQILTLLDPFGPTAVLAGFFLLSMLLTNVISNQATAALLAPIVIQAAHTLSLSPRPFLMAITFAASLSFMTPVGYQTNTLIYGPGQYKFTDFTKVGTPLNLIFWVLASLLIPVFWPF